MSQVVSHETFPQGTAQAGSARGPPATPRPTPSAPRAPISNPAGLHAPAQPKLLIPHEGRLVKLKGVDNSPNRRGGGTRGEVRGFSRQSRLRLMELCASLQRTARPDRWLFLTLTYPGAYPNDPAQWHRDLAVLFKRLKRAYPECTGLWKLELQERGAPHFHILAYGRGHIPNRWLSIAWYEVVASGDSRHLAAGTRVERPKTWRGVVWYASKYIGKVIPTQAAPKLGRIWGVHNRAHLPRQPIEYDVSWGTFHMMRRIMRRYNNGAKPMPGIPNSGTRRTSYHMKNTKATRGCRLFIDAALGEQMYRAARLAAQSKALDPPN